MRGITRPLAALLLSFALPLSAVAAGQAEEPASPVKVQVVFSEYEGDKKLASLPYVLSTVVGGDPNEKWNRDSAGIRLGISVPILVQSKEGNPLTQYMDVGTDIDCRIKRLDNGRFALSFDIHRSSVYSAQGKEDDAIRAYGQAAATPLIRKYTSSFDLTIRDGETVQGPVATDPQSGRVLRIDVTLNVGH